MISRIRRGRILVCRPLVSVRVLRLSAEKGQRGGVIVLCLCILCSSWIFGSSAVECGQLQEATFFVSWPLFVLDL